MLFLILVIVLNINSQRIIDQERVSLYDTKVEQEVDEIISSLSLEEKIGQMLLYGFKGTDAKKEALKLIDKYKIGGVILYSHNIDSQKQLLSLNKSLQNYSIKNLGVPLFIAIDQEGGKVVRINQFGTVLPSNMNIGATRSPELSFLAGKLTAIDLENLGINLNLAPVLDVNREPNNTVIGSRSYSDNPSIVAELGSFYIRGIQSRYVSASAKHFPGHGSTKGDSHFGLPISYITYEELEKKDLKPFKQAIKEDVDTIMTAHVSFPKIDKSGKPATVSKIFIDDILRKKLSYNGIIITDDMEMKGVSEKDYDAVKHSVEAIKAGCDIVMVAWTNKYKDKVYKEIVKKVKNGEISKERIEKSVRRILRVKVKRGFFENKFNNNYVKSFDIVGNSFHQEISSIISNRSITLLGNKNILPIKKDKSIVLISPFSFLSDELNKKGFKNKFFRVDVSLNNKDIDQIVSKILIDKNRPDYYMVAMLDSSHTSIVKRLKKISSKPVIAISLDTPYFYYDIKDVDTFICAYSFRSSVLNSVSKILTGEIEAKGILPVKL
jgi:beta-N-acetylhexosaminidase